MAGVEEEAVFDVRLADLVVQRGSGEAALEFLERVLAAPEGHPQWLGHQLEEAAAGHHVDRLSDGERGLAGRAGSDDKRQVSANEMPAVEPLTARQAGGLWPVVGSIREARGARPRLRRRLLDWLVLGLVLRRLSRLLGDRYIPLLEGRAPLRGEGGPAAALALETILLARAVRRQA